MRLVRYGDRGRERPGILGPDNLIRDLSAILADWTPENLSPGKLAKVSSLPVDDLPIVRGSPRLGVPVNGVKKFIAIGLNYTDHAREANLPIPTEPVIFSKAISCLSGPNDDIVLPKGSHKTDWEVELGIVMGRPASNIDVDEALSLVAGYCLVNDVSEREFQLERGGTWDKGKGCDTFGPVGPWLVTSGEITDPQNVDLWLDVNGTRCQNGHTSNMIFPVSYLVAYVSQFITLEAGDVIATGTPAGVGLGRKPQPQFLKEDDVVRLGSAQLGSQIHRVTAWTSHGRQSDC
jgi:2,4-didehydro-3-deoxy-L-rhamnonate hydrolase